MTGQSRTIVVTGASQGIGGALVDRFVAAGDRVVAIARQADRLAALAERHGDAVRTLAADIAHADTAPRALEIADGLGGCDVLVNNVGIFPAAAFLDADIDDARRVMEVNFFAAFALCRAFAPGMVGRGGAPIPRAPDPRAPDPRAPDPRAIVNVTSIAARSPTPALSAYAASKGAIEAFSRVLAAELAPHVRVNCLSPGPTRTETVEAMAKSDTTGAVEAVSRAIPMGRYGEPEEVAEGVFYLAGANWVTGQVLQVNGGLIMA